MSAEESSYNMQFGVLSCIGIVCVVMGHLDCDILTFGNWLPYASFHMPLFFFISGYFYKNNVEVRITIADYAIKLVKKLLIPFYIIYIIYYFIQQLLNIVFHCTFNFEKNFIFYIIAPFTRTQPVGFCSSAWFVITLLGVRFIHFCVQKVLWYLKKNKQTRILITMLLYIAVGVLAFKYESRDLNGWERNILKVCFGLSFYQIGIIYGMIEDEIDQVNDFVYFGLLILLREMLWIRTGWGSISFYNFGDVEEGYFPIVYSAMIGILIWARIARYISENIKINGLIIQIGKSTFEIMMHHLFVVFLLQGIGIAFYNTVFRGKFDIAAYKSSIYYLATDNPLLPITLSFISVLIISKYTIVKKYFKQKSFKKKTLAR